VDGASFRAALESSPIRSSLFLRLATSGVTTLLAVLVAVPSAYALSRFRFRGIVLLDTTIDLSIVMPPW